MQAQAPPMAAPVKSQALGVRWQWLDLVVVESVASFSTRARETIE
jgi:hypothetical protein